MESFSDFKDFLNLWDFEFSREFSFWCVRAEPLNQRFHKLKDVWRAEIDVIVEVPDENLVNFEFAFVDSIVKLIDHVDVNVRISHVVVTFVFAVEQNTV